MADPNVCVLVTDGSNCDIETAYAFEDAGARTEIVHINQFREGEYSLDDFNGLALPGGFSYGDDIASGKVLANELTSYLSDPLQRFADSQKPIIGICNGFQVLVRTGLLPNRQLGEQSVTLAQNESGRFECRWVGLSLGSSACRYLQPDDVRTDSAFDGIPMQVAHGEGRFTGNDGLVRQLSDNSQVMFRYNKGDNPNGSHDDIAGICDPTGTILGMMPHPERSITSSHPDTRRTGNARSAAKTLFRNIVRYMEQS